MMRREKKSARHAEQDLMKPVWTVYSDRQRWCYLGVLFLVATVNYVDRNIISVLLESIKREFQVSDTMLGLLGGISFAFFYATLGLPMARWADRGNRKTIIALSIAAWSVMTALCGLANTFWQLAAARIGVGVGESGAIPPANSLIADYFPPERRSSAFAIFVSAGMAGYLISFLIGGQVAAAYGWRMAFLAASLPGLALTVIVHFVLDEPRVREGRIASPVTETLRHTARQLWKKRSYRELTGGMTLYFFVAYGANIFVPSFLMRVLHVPLAQVSVKYGTVAGISSVIGTIGGGIIADRLSRRDVRWLAWMPAVACACAFVAYMLSFAMPDLNHFLTVNFFAGIFIAAGLPPVFSALQAICGSPRRAVAVAVCFFFANLLGLGLGPVVTGALSDALSIHYGPDGLRYALMIVEVVSLGVAWFYFRCGKSMPPDLED
jgi:MFS family permease